MITTKRTWDDFSHAERAAQHRANAESLRRHKPAAGSSLDPARMAEAEDRAAEAEEALAAEECAAAR